MGRKAAQAARYRRQRRQSRRRLAIAANQPQPLTVRYICPICQGPHPAGEHARQSNG